MRELKISFYTGLDTFLCKGIMLIQVAQWEWCHQMWTAPKTSFLKVTNESLSSEPLSWPLTANNTH